MEKNLEFNNKKNSRNRIINNILSTTAKSGKRYLKTKLNIVITKQRDTMCEYLHQNRIS